MAPRPIEHIDFPALGDQILDLLLALWTFVCDLCSLLWSYVSDAFWAVWTYPPFETFRNAVVATLICVQDYVVAHPITTMAIVFLFLVTPRVLYAFRAFLLNCFLLCLVILSLPLMLFLHCLAFFLDCLGFGAQGVLRDSYAASYPSTRYGRNVLIPRGSAFAQFQSYGARDAGGYRTVGGTGSPNC